MNNNMVKIIVGGIEIETEGRAQSSLKDEQEYVIAPMEAVSMPVGWISVQDQLPPDLHEVLYFAINPTGSKEIMTGHRQKGEWTHCCLWYSTQILNADVKVTHWMELPDYPRSK